MSRCSYSRRTSARCGVDLTIVINFITSGVWVVVTPLRNCCFYSKDLCNRIFIVCSRLQFLLGIKVTNDLTDFYGVITNFNDGSICVDNILTTNGLILLQDRTFSKRCGLIERYCLNSINAGVQSVSQIELGNNLGIQKQFLTQRSRNSCSSSLISLLNRREREETLYVIGYNITVVKDLDTSRSKFPISSSESL